MADIDKEIQYWKQGATEDWDVAMQLVGDMKIRHGLFFAHLAFEKALKAHICRQSRNHPPRIHNLVRLAEMAELKQKITFMEATHTAKELDKRFTEITELKAHIERLRETIIVWNQAHYPELVTKVLSESPAHSLIEHDKQVIRTMVENIAIPPENIHGNKGYISEEDIYDYADNLEKDNDHY